MTALQVHKKAVILDTDIGDTIDDAWALALLLRAPEIDLKLVLVGLGSEQDLTNRARVARHLLDTAGAHHVPVGLGIRCAKGLEKCPNVGSYWLPPDSEPAATNFLEDGVGAMLGIVKCHASALSPVTIICIGPATNIAEAVRQRGADFANCVNLIGQFGKLKGCSEFEPNSTCESDSRPPDIDDKVAVTFDDEGDVNSAYDTDSLKEVLRAPFLSITCCTLELVGSASENFSKARYQSLCKVRDPLVKQVLSLDSKYDTYMRCLGARGQETWYSDLRPMKDLPSMFWDATVVFVAMRPSSTLSFSWQPAFAQGSYSKPVQIAWGLSAGVEAEFSSFLVQRLLGTCDACEQTPSMTPGPQRDEQIDDRLQVSLSTSDVSSSTTVQEETGITSEVKEDKCVLGLLYFSVFLDLLGFGLILPLVPYLGTKFHADSVGLGLLTSMFSITKFVGSIAFGMAADRIGKKMTICICSLGCVISYLAMGFANDFKVLVLTRGLAGFFSNTVVVVQSVIPIAVPADKRLKHQGYIGAAIGAGIAFGPGIGGGMSHFGIQSPIFLTAALCALNFSLVLCAMPKFGPSTTPSLTGHRKVADTGKTMKCLQALQITLVLTSTLIFWLGYASFEALGGLYFADSLSMGPGEFGIVCTVTGVVQLVLLAGMVKPMVRCAGEIGAGALAFTLSTVGWLLLMIKLPWIPYVAAVPIGAGFMVQAVQANLLSSMSSSALVGTLLGVNQAMASLGRIVGPLMAGVIYPYLPLGIWIASASLALLGVMSFALLFVMKQPYNGITCPNQLERCEGKACATSRAEDLECGC